MIDPKDFDNLDDFLAAVEAAKRDKKAQKQPRHKVPASKPYPREKEFVTMNYFAPESLTHTQYKRRAAGVETVKHIYNYSGEEISVGSDKRFLDSDIVVVHPHPWEIPCSPAPAQQDCRVIKERKSSDDS